jgi:hypothetical protein
MRPLRLHARDTLVQFAADNLTGHDPAGGDIRHALAEGFNPALWSVQRVRCIVHEGRIAAFG